PRVNLDKPTTRIDIFFIGSRAYAGLFLFEIEHDFEGRKAHLRPKMFPTSLHPKLARAMVNMTGIKKGTIVDPFCGTGGILIEAALMGIKAKGYDINPEMVSASIQNTKGLKGVKVEVKDARKLDKKIGYVVTDMPYGRNSTAERHLYRKFFKVLDSLLLNTAVIGIPSEISGAAMLKGTGLKLKTSITYYLHRSLSKKILVVSK
ncbi:MAG: DNA methyltransferase, partial [Candidatus Woesearchaeota archaeon]